MQGWNDPCMLPPEIAQYVDRRPLEVQLLELPKRRASKGPRGTSDKTGQASRQRQRAAIIARWGSDCWLCDEAIDLELKWPHPRSFTRDHVKPRSKGGRNAIENMRPAHNECNHRRGDKEVTR